MLWVLAVTAVILIAIFSRIEDWGRDLSTNVAMTGENTTLKPLRLTGSVEQTVDKLRTVVESMSHWTWIDQAGPVDGTVTVNLVRRTTLFRFKDDVQVSIVSADDESGSDKPSNEGFGVVINAISRSRVGKGDLGQNPRNIRELFAKLGA
jgi:uncharacterized protein (DUF1499 family)